MGAVDRLLHRNKAAQPASDVATTGTAGPASGMMGMIYRPRMRRLEDRLLLDAVPEAAVVDLPDDQFINEDFQFTVSFDNTSPTPTDVGYGPFVDVTVGPGIEVNNVTYLGASLQSQEVGTWDGTQWVDGSGNPVTQHPLDTVGGQLALPVGSIEGETWINVLAPFGSYTPDQPAIDLVFSATMEESPDADPETGAVPGDDIIVTARGGFRFGADPLDNPTTDAPIQQGATQSDTVTPIVMRLEKDVQLAEDETAQGPNFPFTYTISVDIADGVTVTDINIQDLLPANLFFLTATTNITADEVSAPGVGGTAQGVPGIDTITTATWTFDSVTGQEGEGDIVITLTAYAPEFAADGTDLNQMDEDDPISYLATNNAEVESANYEAANGESVAISPDNSGQLEDSIDIIIRPYTVLKTASIEGGGDATPGSFVRYEIDIDVSDYLALEEGILTDVLADGLTLNTTDNALLDHTPVLRVEMNGEVFLFDLTETVPPGDETELTAVIQGNGTQQVTFFLSAAVRNAGATDETLFGDLFNGDGQEGPTRMTLTYYALINENYRVKGGGAPVVVNDTLTNSVNLTLNSQTSGNAAQADGSSDQVVIDPPVSQKSLYAVNDEIGAPAQIAPGDEVTYRVRIEVGSADVDDLVITDFLPSPIYNVDEEGGFTFVAGAPSAGVPAAYTVKLGPDDTLSGTDVVGNPIVTIDAASNSIIFTYGDFNELLSQGGVIDLLYTITVLDEPFADGLLLTNQAVIQTANSDAVIDDDVIINDVVFHQPELSVTKGVVATDANGAVDDSLAFDPATTTPPGMDFTVGTDGFTGSVTAEDLAATPIDSNLTGVDGGDTVKFAVTVQNSGGEDAFDVVLNDTLPSGFAIPAGAVLTVQYGDGTAVSFTDLEGNPATIDDFFGDGIMLVDDDANGIGAVAAAGDANGHDIIIISFELVAADNVLPGVTTTNTAEIVSFAALEGGNDFTEGVTGDFTDDAEVTAQGVAVEKRLVSTDQPFTGGNDLTIGETGTFQIEVTMPDGATEAIVTDVLPQGMVLVGAPVIRLTFTNADGDTVTFAGTVQQGGVTLADGQVLAFTQTGNTLTFNFGNIITNAAPGTDLAGQSFVIEYQAQATDDPALVAGVTATNTTTLDTPTTDPVSDTAAVDIVEPDLTVTKTFEPNVAEAGQTVDMTISVQNGSGTFTTTSFGLNLTDFDVDLSEAVFSSITFVSMSGTGGVTAQIPNDVAVDVQLVGGQWQITVTATDDFAIAPGERLNLLFSMTIAQDVETGTVVENTATIVDDGYSSLPGDDPDERLFGPEEGTDTLTIATPTITKTIINTSYGGTEQLSPGDAGYLADSDTDVLVGEIVTYQLNVRIPRGVSNDVIVYDDTNFVTADGTVGIMEIVGVDSIVVGGSIIQVTDETVQLLDIDGDGIAERLQINFGELTNNATVEPPDVAAESIVIVFRAQILDVTETNDGDVHTNGTAVTFTVGGEPNFNVADTFPTVTVHEPNIDLVKTATTPDSTTDAGDVVTYTLTISHTEASSADGFSLDLTDVLDDDMVLVAGSATIDAGAAAQGLAPLELSDVTLDTVNNQVLVSGFDLGLNQTVTITYQAVVAGDVVSGQQLTNNVSLTYQSLPELDPVDSVDPSTAVAGAITPVESDLGPLESETRAYADDATATVIITQPGPITKTTDKTSYTIGEVINYTVQIPVIEGQTVDPVLTDILPAGQDFIEGSGSIVTADGTVLTGTFTQVGQSLVLDGDTFTTLADNDDTNDFITITFQARVQNVADNNNGDTKTNTATFESEGQPDRTDDVSIEIVEPDIVMTKTNDATGPVNAGDVITYTLTAEHSSESTADAFEFSFTDNLPANMGAVAIVSATVNGEDVSDQLVFDQGTGVLTGTDIDIPLGASLIVVYQVVVLDSAGPNQTITNTASGNWSSLDGDQNPGAEDGERDGSETPAQNDYVTSADAQIVTDNNIELTKTASVEQATIGETVTYTLDITVFEGTLQNVVVQDFTQAGLEIDLASLQIVGSGFAGAAGLEIVNPTLVPSPTVPGAFLLTFQLQNSADGSLVNPGDNNAGTDTIRITYTAVVVNDLVNQDGAQIDNAADVQADNTPGATGADSITLLESEITIDKTVVSPAGPVDAGDIIDYQVVLTNTGTSTAFDVTFFDLAPLNTIFTGTVTAVDGSGNPIGSFTIAADGSRIDGSGFDIAVGASVTLTYSVTVVETVESGDVVTNAATVRWTSTSGTNPDERTGDEGHPDGNFDDDGPDDTDDTLNNYEATDTTTVATDFEIDVAKQLIGSSLDDTTGNQLTIGETATFAIDVSLTEGTTPGVVVVDQLPDGFVFTPGSLQVIAPEGTFFDGQTTLDPTAIVYDPATDTLTINLGTVTTPASNDTTPGAPDLRVIRLQYSGIVFNQLSNQDTVALANSVTVTTTAAGIGPDTAGPVEITVVEPEITVDKTVVSPAGPVDAGDVIDYQVVLTNTGTSTAFDVDFTDLAPENTSFTGDVLDENGVVVGGFTVSDGQITGTIDQIAVGASVTLRYSVTVQGTIAPGDAVTNVATARWSSIPGDNDDERTGEDGHPDGNFDDDGPDDTDDTLNNYEATDTTTVTTDFEIDVAKQFIGSDLDDTTGSQLTIGETGTFAIDVSLTEGTTPGVVVVDQLPDGFVYTPGSLEVDAPAGTLFNGLPTLDPSAIVYDPATDTLTINLGNVTIPSTDDGAPGTPDLGVIRLTYDGVVFNQLSNQETVPLANSVTVTTTAPGVGPDTAGPVEITVVEPEITIDKTVVSPAGPVDAGDVVTYQVVLTNTGTSTAFDVDFTDVVPTNGLFTGTVTAVDQNGAAVGSFAISPDGTVISGDSFDIAVGGTVTITYSLTVQDTVTNADSLVNQANVTWTSMPGANANERDGDDGEGPDAFVLDNYAASDTATVDAGFEISLVKTLTSSSVAETTGNQLTIGETGTYALDITISEGTINNLMVVDVTDAWMGIDLDSLTAEDIGFAGGTVTIMNATLSVNAFGVATLSFQLDNTPGTPEIELVNPGDPFGDTTDNDTIRITYSATVLNNILNQDGDVISNTATISAGDGIAPVADSETISLVEPDLVIDKRAILPIVTVGGTARYEIEVFHSDDSHVDAFDVVVSDPFNNPLLTLNPGSITATVENGTGTAVVTLVGTGFQVSVDRLELGARLVINFTAQSVVTEGADGSTIPNTSTVDYDTIPGVQTPDEQRNYTEMDTAAVTIVGPDLVLVKDASVDIIEPGDLFTYDIQVQNIGAPGVDDPLVETARNVVFTDILPEDVELLSVSVDGVDTPFTFDPTTRVITVALANIPPDVTRTVTLFMQASDTFSPATSGGTGDVELINVAEVDMSQTDPTPENNIDDATIITRAIPDLVVTKTNAVEEIGGGDTVEFTITAQNVGERVAAGVQIIDRVDTTVFEFISASDGGVFDPVSGTVTWRLDTLSPDDGMRTFTMVLKVRPGLSPSVDDTTDVVTVNDNGQGGPDPTPQNNIDTHTDRLIYPDLVITKANGVDEVSPGDIVDYVITVQNVGEFRADGVVVRDVIDTRVFRFVSATNGGVFDPATGVVTWRLGTVNPGDPPIVLGLTLEVLFPTSTDIDQAVNAVEVNGDGMRGRDANPSNNFASDSDILDAAPDPFEIERVLGDDEEEEEEEIEEPLYIAPLFTGKSAIGAMVRITLIGRDGAPIDTGTTRASPDGNWMLTMNDVEGPAPVSAIVTTSPPTVTALGALDRTNVFFNPGVSTPIDFHRSFDVYSAMDSGSAIVLRDQMEAMEDPLAVASRRYINFNAVGGTAISDD